MAGNIRSLNWAVPHTETIIFYGDGGQRGSNRICSTWIDFAGFLGIPVEIMVFTLNRVRLSCIFSQQNQLWMVSPHFRK